MATTVDRHRTNRPSHSPGGCETGERQTGGPPGPAGGGERAALEEARLRLIGRVAAGLAHDLNGPMGVILGFTQLAQGKIAAAGDGAPDVKALGQYLEMIEHAGNSARRLAQDIWDFARSRYGQVGDFDVRATVNAAGRLVAPALRVARIDPPQPIDEPGADDEALVVRGDAALWTQALVDLLAGALVALPEGGSVRWTIAPGEGDATVTVALEAAPTDGAGPAGGWRGTEEAAAIIRGQGGEIRPRADSSDGRSGVIVSIPAASRSSV